MTAQFHRGDDPKRDEAIVAGVAREVLVPQHARRLTDAAEHGRKPVVHEYIVDGNVEDRVYDALRSKRELAEQVLHCDGAPSCPFHADRAQVRNGMCGDCAEKADDARC